MENTITIEAPIQAGWNDGQRKRILELDPQAVFLDENNVFTQLGYDDLNDIINGCY